MARLPLALLLATALVACSDAPASGTAADAAPASAEAPPPETPPASDTLDVPVADADALASFFDADQTAAAVAYAEAFGAVETGADLRAAYDRALALEPLLLGPLAEGYDVWAEMDRFLEADLGLPGLAPTCVGECTVPAFTLDLSDWQRAADNVGDAGAEAYVEALDAAYSSTYIVEGRLGGWPAYQTQTWDYGGHSTLGSRTHAELLELLEAAEGDLFADEIAALRADVRQDVLTTACIGPTAAQAREELVWIRDAGLLASDAEALDARIAAFGRPGATGIEAGCAGGGCGCEGG